MRKDMENKYSVGGTILSGMIGAYIGYKYAESNKGKKKGRKLFSNGGGVKHSYEIEQEGDEFIVEFYKSDGTLDWGRGGFSSREEAEKYALENRRYSEGGEVGMSDVSQANDRYLNSISAEEKSEILKNIANHYGISVSDAEEEVTENAEEFLYEFIADDASLRMKVYTAMKRNGEYAEGGAVAEYWQPITDSLIYDGVHSYSMDDIDDEETLLEGQVWIKFKSIPKGVTNLPYEVKRAIESDFEYYGYSNTAYRKSVDLTEGSWFDYYIQFRNLTYQELEDLLVKLPEQVAESLEEQEIEGYGELGFNTYGNPINVDVSSDNESEEEEDEENDDEYAYYEVYDEETGKSLMIYAYDQEDAETIAENLSFEYFEDGDEYNPNEDDYAKGGGISDVVVYDNGGESFDRYTIFTPDGSVFGMSDNALMPNGFNMYIGDDTEIQKGSHLGKKLKSVPQSIKIAVERRMNEEFAKGGEVSKPKRGLSYGKKDDVYFDVVTLLNSKMQKPKGIFGQEKPKVQTMSLDSLMEYLKYYEIRPQFEVDLPTELFTKESFLQYRTDDSKFRFISGKIYRLGKEELIRKLIDSYITENGRQPNANMLAKFERLESVKYAPEKTTIVQRIMSKQLLAKGGGIGFKGLSAKVAKRYEGKKVAPKYQSQYGTTYSKSEAKEVGDKVAGKVYWNQQGRKMAQGGGVKSSRNEDIKECKKLVKAFCKEYGERFKLNEKEIMSKVSYNGYLGHGASVFVGLQVNSNIDNLKVGEIKPTTAFVRLSSDINPNGVSKEIGIARSYVIEFRVEGSVRKRGGRTEEKPFFYAYQYGTTIDEVMNKFEGKVLYDLFPLEFKNGLKLSMSVVFAEGGMTEHGLREGDIILGKFSEDSKDIEIADKNNKFVLVDLDKGMRSRTLGDVKNEYLPQFGENRYVGKTNSQVWNGWSESQRKHFLDDHRVLMNDTLHIQASKYRYNELPNDLLVPIERELKEHIESPSYAKGGGVNGGMQFYVAMADIRYFDSEGEYKKYTTYNHIKAESEEQAKMILLRFIENDLGKNEWEWEDEDIYIASAQRSDEEIEFRGYLSADKFGGLSKDKFSKGRFAEGGGVDEVISINIQGYPYYLKKMGDTTHFKMANSKDGIDMVIGSHIAQHKGEEYYSDVASWLKGGKSPNGKSYSSYYYAEGGGISGLDDLVRG